MPRVAHELRRPSFFSLAQVVPIVPGRFVLAAVADAAAFDASEFAREHVVYSIDDELVRERETG